MFIYKFSPNRIYFINEYWIFIPTAILVDILIIKHVRARRKRKKKELEKQLYKQLRLRRILALVFSRNSSLSVPNGGSFTVEDLNTLLDSARVPEKLYDCICSYEIGASYLDNNRFRNIISRNFAKKIRNKVIYITVSALCELIKDNGVFQWSAPVPIIVKDFGITDLVQTGKKFIGTGFVATGPLILALGNGGLAYRILSALPVLVSGVKIILWNPEKIATSLISHKVNIRELSPRIPSQTEVIVLNYRGCNKIVMPEFTPTPNDKECWLADQAMFNKKCSTYKLPDELDTPDLSYEEVVTLKDVKKLDEVEFEDIEDIGQLSKASKVKAKLVKFLEKFGDDDTTEHESWETSEDLDLDQPVKRYLRYRQEN